MTAKFDERRTLSARFRALPLEEKRRRVLSPEMIAEIEAREARERQAQAPEEIDELDELDAFLDELDFDAPTTEL